MKIQCDKCHRDFDLIDEKIRDKRALRCVCGNALNVRPPIAEQRLGKYVLVNRIATGGMGEIYYGKVSGVEGFEKEVALKRMLPHLSADRDFINMMVKEAKLTVLLNHPNIVGIYDLSKEGEEYYIAMEYVPGVTVGAILEQARASAVNLPWELAVHIVMQVLRGLAYAHNLPTPTGERLTILHRDITPQNILVTTHAFVKITDFGIAKAVNEISTTSPGMIKGKLGYIAPEQLEGREPDQRVDLFCAAILLWEMCAVRRLFKGNSEIDTFRLISECRIPSLSHFRDDLPVAVEAVLQKGLAKDPDSRYARAEDFNAALSQAIYPRTADDFAELTATYFHAHPEFFASIAAHKVPNHAPLDATRAIPMGDYAGITELDSVNLYMRESPKKPLNFMPLAAVLAACLLMVLGGGAWWLLHEGQKAKTAALAPGSLTTIAPADETHGLTAVVPSPAVAPIAAASPAVAPVAAASPAIAPIASASPAVAPPMSALPPAPLPTPIASLDVTPPEPRVNMRPLTGAEIQAMVQHHYQRILSCLNAADKSQVPSRMNAQVTIENTGKVSQVTFTPTLESPDVQSCLLRVMMSMRARKYRGGQMRVTIPLQVKMN